MIEIDKLPVLKAEEIDIHDFLHRCNMANIEIPPCLFLLIIHEFVDIQEQREDIELARGIGVEHE